MTKATAEDCRILADKACTVLQEAMEEAGIDVSFNVCVWPVDDASTIGAGGIVTDPAIAAQVFNKLADDIHAIVQGIDPNQPPLH